MDKLNITLNGIIDLFDYEYREKQNIDVYPDSVNTTLDRLRLGKREYDGVMDAVFDTQQYAFKQGFAAGIGLIKALLLNGGTPND